MKCYTCGGTCEAHNGTLGLQNKIIGSYNIYDANYYKCASCEKISYPKETILKIESVEDEIKNKLIGSLPINEFILASEAAELLGVTKQAFNKHRRIKKGFVYSISLGSKKLYHKNSIIKFKESGDGRFPLSSQKQNEIVKFRVKPLLITAVHANYQKTVSDTPIHPIWQAGWTEPNQQLFPVHYRRHKGEQKRRNSSAS